MDKIIPDENMKLKKMYIVSKLGSKEGTQDEGFENGD